MSRRDSDPEAMLGFVLIYLVVCAFVISGVVWLLT